MSPSLAARGRGAERSEADEDLVGPLRWRSMESVSATPNRALWAFHLWDARTYDAVGFTYINADVDRTEHSRWLRPTTDFWASRRSGTPLGLGLP
jgi:hypothetical protein